MRLRVFIGLSILMLAGCAHKKIAAKWPVTSRDFVDLLPGRVREITPIFASGGFIAKGQEQQNGNIITLTGTDFQGYETAVYALKAHNGGGVAVELESVETTKGEQITKEAKLQPRVPLFQFPRRVRYIRLLYLIRVSGADHNMAVLGSDDMDRLNALTKQVQGDPAGSCKNVRHAYCSWVPAGVAVNSFPANSGP